MLRSLPLHGAAYGLTPGALAVEVRGDATLAGVKPMRSETVERILASLEGQRERAK